MELPEEALSSKHSIAPRAPGARLPHGENFALDERKLLFLIALFTTVNMISSN